MARHHPDHRANRVAEDHACNSALALAQAIACTIPALGLARHHASFVSFLFRLATHFRAHSLTRNCMLARTRTHNSRSAIILRFRRSHVTQPTHTCLHAHPRAVPLQSCTRMLLSPSMGLLLRLSCCLVGCLSVPPYAAWPSALTIPRVYPPTHLFSLHTRAAGVRGRQHFKFVHFFYIVY